MAALFFERSGSTVSNCYFVNELLVLHSPHQHGRGVFPMFSPEYSGLFERTFLTLNAQVISSNVSFAAPKYTFSIMWKL
jgi:hypothetical protein